MNKLFEYINNNFRTVECLLFVVMVCLMLINLYLDPIHKKNIEKLSEEPPLIVCSFCKGTGERPTDVNKLMMDAKLALFINHHLNIDKCEECVKLPYGDAYDYCDTVQNKYKILVQEYADAGPKIDMASCGKCMGMGTFSSKDMSTGKWITQEEYDEKHKQD